MKKLMMCASALALLGACGVSKEANAALAAMNIADGGSGMVKYASKSGSGDKVTLKDVVIGQEQGDGLRAETMVLDGLGMVEGKPVVESITLNKLVPAEATPGLVFTVAKAEVESENDATSAYLASAFAEAGPGSAPPFEQWALEKMSLTGLNLQADLAAMGLGPSGSFNMTLDEVSVADLKDTVFGAAKLEGLKGDFDVPAEAGAGFPIKGTFDFGTMNLSGVQGKLFANAFEAGMQSATMPANAGDVTGAQTDIFAGLTSPIDPGYTSAKWTPMHIEASGARLDFSGGESEVKRNGEGVATTADSSRATIKFSTNAANGQLGAMAGMFLGMLNYQAIELYGEADATYDPATDTTRYTKYDFGMTDGFDISFTGAFQGLTDALEALMSSASAQPSIDPETGEVVMPETDMSGVEALKVVELDLTLTDKSLVNRLLGLAPMVGGSDPETLRTDLVNQIRALGADLGGAGVDPAVAQQFSTAVANFVQSPGVLKIRMNPPAPVSLAKEGQQLNEEALGLTVVHTPAASSSPAPAQ